MLTTTDVIEKKFLQHPRKYFKEVGGV